jgi:hypothetical protein
VEKSVHDDEYLYVFHARSTGQSGAKRRSLHRPMGAAWAEDRLLQPRRVQPLRAGNRLLLECSSTGSEVGNEPTTPHRRPPAASQEPVSERDVSLRSPKLLPLRLVARHPQVAVRHRFVSGSTCSHAGPPSRRLPCAVSSGGRLGDLLSGGCLPARNGGLSLGRRRSRRTAGDPGCVDSHGRASAKGTRPSLLRICTADEGLSGRAKHLCVGAEDVEGRHG